jgi:undecaprenyl diphosphate synthase
MVFMNVLWPDVTRETLWEAIEIYAARNRRFGKA